MGDPHISVIESDSAPEGESRKRGAPRGHHRFSAIPPLPTDPRRELDLLKDNTGPLGFLLWRTISDILLWIRCPKEQRGQLFHSAPSERSDALALATIGVPEAKNTLQMLLTVSSTPELVDLNAVAEACAEMSAWAETRGMMETAVQFAEAAARMEPDVSARSSTAGRLCRRLGDHPRSATWFRRAMRLARRTQAEGIKYSEIDFANAHRGYGFLLADLGKMAEAEPHFWKSVRAALRAGKKSLAGAGYHDLLMVTVHLERWPEALEHAKQAATLYKDGHPRFPLLAFDIAFMWCRQGYFSSALPILEKILPWVEHQRERILVLASLARSAGAVRDHIRYVRAAREVLAMAAVDTEMTASSLYHIAEGARCFYEWDRAQQLATRSLELARKRDNATVMELSERLLIALAAREPGDIDAIPEEGSVVDATRELIMRKLEKQPPPELSSEGGPPERYPKD